MKCDLLASQDLFHPVIPVRIPLSKNGHKLMFTLCAQCAKEQNLDEFRRTANAERNVATPEIYYAIEFGYEIIQIHQVWDYPDRVIGIIKHYIDAFLKVKQESSDWPAWCTAEDLQ